MNEPKRRNLLAGLAVERSEPSPSIEDVVAVTAARHGFVSPHEAPTQAGATSAAPRRQRKLLGRTQQFNVRLRPTTVEQIYDIANSRDVAIAQVIEDALDAYLKAHDT